MLQDEGQPRDFWPTFKDSPLFAKWKDAEKELSGGFESMTRRAGEMVFRSGEPAEFLYLVASGVIQQTLRHEGTVWLQREFRRGDYFGQHALFGRPHLSETVALSDAVLFKVPASVLRTAMERNRELYETLLQEKRSGRLRAIPLFRDLSDEQIMRLALLMEECPLAPGEAPPMAEKPGLYIIDYGQIAVSGPASLERREWRLTAGNFFLTAGVRFGTRCIADEARATLASNLFYLPAEHSDRLIPAFPDVGQLVHRPLDIVEILGKIPLFAGPKMTRSHLLHLAHFCGWGFVPERQNVTTQGAVGHSFVILREGAAVVSNADEFGRLRPRSPLRAGQSYGETSLLQGKPRDATVRAVAGPGEGSFAGVRGADVLTLDRRDLQHAFEERRDLWDARVALFSRFVRTKEEKKSFDWQADGEVVIWKGRGHVFWLFFPNLPIVALAVALFLAAQLGPDAWRGFLTTFWLVCLGIMALVIVFLVINYFDDYYVVTNRRVVRRDRQVLLFAESRMEAAIETVQDVTVNMGFWGNLFDFGDLTVRTAAKVGAVTFAHVPRAAQVKMDILEGKKHALELARGQQREALRRGLISQLRLVLPIPERRRALGENAPLPGSKPAKVAQAAPRKPHLLPSRQRTAPVRAWQAATRPLPERLRKALAGPPPAAPQELPGQVVWRKHPIVLVMRAWVPFAGLVLLMVLLPVLDTLAVQLAAPLNALFLPWLVLVAIFLGWLWWRVEDYRNDIYVVTDEKIIDIEMKPLGLDMKRREGSLERVQTVDAQQRGILPVIFNYGNVIIRTAAADEGYDFVKVPNPKHVQRVVFQKLDAVRQRQEARRAEERQRELIEGLQVYDELREARERSSPRRP